MQRKNVCVIFITLTGLFAEEAVNARAVIRVKIERDGKDW
jgi:hypothetical protein